MSSVRSYFPHQIIRIHSVPDVASERIGDVIFTRLQFTTQGAYLLFVLHRFKAVSLRQSHQQRFKTIPQRDRLTAVFQTRRDLFDKQIDLSRRHPLREGFQLKLRIAQRVREADFAEFQPIERFRKKCRSTIFERKNMRKQ